MGKLCTNKNHLNKHNEPQIFDNCANQQKDNRINKADNKEKTKTPFSENSSFQEKYTQQSQFFFL
jgi:hypothetical protein